MKKIVLIFTAFFSIFLVTGQAFEKEDKVLNVGIGLGDTYYGGYYSTVIPPLSASFEFGISDKVGIGYFGAGPYVGYTSSKDADTYKYQGIRYEYGYKSSAIVIGGRAAYHYDLNHDRWDLYTGLLLGYVIVQSRFFDDGNIYDSYYRGGKRSGLGWAGYVGVRYNFGKTAGVFAELGYGISLLNTGLAVKF